MNLSDIVIIDIIFLAIIFISIFFACIKGFTKEFFHTLGLLFGYILIGRYMNDFIPLVKDSILFVQKYLFDNKEYGFSLGVTKLIAYLIGISGGYLFGKVLGLIGSYLFSNSISFINRFFAIWLGIFKGFIICMILFIILRDYFPIFSDELKASLMAPKLQEVWKILHGWKLA